jgi:tripartite-type tricarboxylate transporter receptor subunit TctC
MIDSYPLEWETSMKKVLAMDWERLIPGHPGQPQGRLGTKQDVRDVLVFLQDASAEVQAQARAGKYWQPAEKGSEIIEVRGLARVRSRASARGAPLLRIVGMRHVSRQCVVRALCVTAAMLQCAAAWAQPAYPSKPIRVLIGFTPGGTIDVIGRILAQKLTDLLGQPVVIENRPGAGANIAAEVVAKSAPDGYTLLEVNPGLAVSATAYRHLKYDAMKDLAPVSQIAIAPHVLIVHPSLPVKSVKDLVALAKSRPGQLNFASGGPGNSDHLAGELFKSMAHIDIVHVPYKGGVQAASDVANGEVSMYFPGLSTAWLLTKSGKVRALAVTTATRSVFEPDWPTMAEAGLPGYEHVLWAALFAPAGTPKEIVTRLNAEIQKALAMPDVRERIMAVGAEPGGSSPERLGALLKNEIEKYGKLIRAIGLRID